MLRYLHVTYLKKKGDQIDDDMGGTYYLEKKGVVYHSSGKDIPVIPVGDWVRWNGIPYRVAGYQPSVWRGQINYILRDTSGRLVHPHAGGGRIEPVNPELYPWLRKQNPRKPNPMSARRKREETDRILEESRISIAPGELVRVKIDAHWYTGVYDHYNTHSRSHNIRLESGRMVRLHGKGDWEIHPVDMRATRRLLQNQQGQILPNSLIWRVKRIRDDTWSVDDAMSRLTGGQPGLEHLPWVVVTEKKHHTFYFSDAIEIAKRQYPGVNLPVRRGY